MSKNSWVGHVNGPPGGAGAILTNGTHTFSNIINNNISGLSINYSN